MHIEPTSRTAQTRIFVTTALTATVTCALIAVGGGTLWTGLGLVGCAAVALLPATARGYFVRRLARVAVTIFLAMGLVWLMVWHFPENPPIQFAGDQLSPIGSNRGSLRELIAAATDPTAPPSRPLDLGGALNGYKDWLAGLLNREMGDTQYSETVGDGVSRTIPLSTQLLAYSQVIAMAIAIPGAFVGARYRNRRPDSLARSASLIGLSTPIYVIGPLLVFVFAVGEYNVFGFDVGARWLPAGRYVPIGEDVVEHVRSMLLPSITLGVNTAAVYLLLFRSEMLQQLSQEHAELAKAKGLAPWRIVTAHAVRPAAPTVVAAIAANSALILGNLVIIERIFLLPGLGDYVTIAIIRNDIPAIVGGIFVTLIILGVINLLADAALLAVDPRLASAERAARAARTVTANGQG